MTFKSKVKKILGSNTQLVRLLILGAILLFMSWMGYRHQVMGGGPAGSPNVDSMCPFGGLETLYSWIKSGAFLRRIAPSSLILFLGTGVITLFAGRVFCGWICPFGAVNEFVSMTARALGIKQFKLSGGIDRAMRIFKYLLLAVILISTWYFGTLTFREYDPWVAWMHLTSAEDLFTVSSLVLLLTLFAGVFIERFWCRYLCPLGAALGLISKVSFVKVKRDTATCIGCSKCSKKCPMGLAVATETVQKNGECISCGNCESFCPVPDTMSEEAAGKKIRFLTVGLLGLALFASVLTGAKISGHWRTFAPPSNVVTGNPVDGIFAWMTIEEAAKAVGLSASQVIEAGGLPKDTRTDISIKKLGTVNDEELKEALKNYLKEKKSSAVSAKDPQEIRGSAVLKEISEEYSLDIKLLLKTLNLPDDTDINTPVKDIMTSVGREVQEVRDAVKKLK